MRGCLAAYAAFTARCIRRPAGLSLDRAFSRNGHSDRMCVANFLWLWNISLHTVQRCSPSISRLASGCRCRLDCQKCICMFTRGV
eukprot:COSAG01_NODE_1409_length_10417_cov_4.920043_2_plen_85_part_00